MAIRMVVQYIVWPLKRAAWVPLVGIGYLALGGAVGSYSLARSFTWIVIGNKQWEEDASNHRGVHQAAPVAPPLTRVPGRRVFGSLPQALFCVCVFVRSREQRACMAACWRRARLVVSGEQSFAGRLRINLVTCALASPLWRPPNFLRELIFRPKIAPFPVAAEGATFLELLSHACTHVHLV